MKTLIKLMTIAFIITSCSSIPNGPDRDNLDEQVSVSRADFINIFGKIIFKNRTVLGLTKLTNTYDYYTAGMCQNTFLKSQLGVHISKAEVASCLTPYISFSKSSHQFRGEYKDLSSNNPFQSAVYSLMQYGLLTADDDVFFGSYRPITGKELTHIIKILEKNRY